MRYLSAVLLSMAVLAGCSGSSPSWRMLPAVEQARTGLAGAAVAGRVAVVGGLTADGTASARADLYDPRRRRWIRLPDLPQAVDRAVATSRGGGLYGMGGYADGPRGPQPTDRAWVLFDRRWHPLPDLPEPRAAGAAAIVRNRIYLVGGVRGTGTDPLARTSLFLDLRTLRWTTFAGVTPPRRDLGAAALAGRVYAVGGRTSGPSDNLATAEAYDTVTRAWTRLPDLPSRRGGGGGGTADRLVVAAGGDGPSGVLAQVDGFDPRENAWRALPRTPRPRTGMALVGAGRAVYQVAGAAEPGGPPTANALSLRIPRD